MIEFQAVTKRYDDGTVAVDHLDLTIEDGKITVFVGPSGCGKTTSLRMINRMIDATSGAILLDGKDIRAQHPADLRRGIGYVIQNAGLFPHRTVLDNVATVPMLLGARKAAARGRAAELLATVGLPAELGKRYPAQLSGGQQQRVGVARALAADPPVLLMDEPFSAVDPVVRDDLQDELLRLQSELGKTIVFVTHDIDEAIKLGDQVAVLRVGGRLAQYDTPAALLAKPVDDFVASFVGRDRGYRALGFLPARQVPIGPVASVPLGTPADVARGRLDAGWAVVVDTENKPLGWVSEAVLSEVDGEIRPEHLISGGSLYVADAEASGTAGTLRNALDAALSSPAAVGIAVDATGAVVGGVTAETVLKALADARRSGEVPT
ncbi:ATP-binding cassette domain-containing protein [Actinokineospora iranica]|uniref:ABC-type quaternary amine transporter n=1 Tax=Actinokineospora iranica TaxID=1271860 RepID=A0A1G6T0D6_9PSEU|nr:ATP-binding cassette domain-containing protein [Actinokineospora iranica]SDD22518.1 osmoprotectant transport system ATP-binding protein [Actinokineospora iranica]